MIPIQKLFGNKKEELSFWWFSDVHQGADVGSLSRAVAQIDNETWDFAVNGGDNMKPDDDGDEHYLEYLDELDSFTNHDINKVYHIGGNHDRTKANDPSGLDFYQKKYTSPFSENNSYYDGQPITPVGTYNAYSVTKGNFMFVCLGDNNGGDPAGGESGLGGGSFNFRASGNISLSQWNWFKSTIENNTDKIIVVGSHIAIKDTTIGTGYNEFRQALWQDAEIDNSLTQNVDDAARRGYIAYIENEEGSFDSETGDSDATNEIKSWLETNGQYIDLWITGHYHRKIGEDWNGRTRYAEKYGTRFLNGAIINSKLAGLWLNNNESKSNIFNIVGDKMTIKTYVHYDPSETIDVGYYEPEEFTIQLKRKYISQ